MPSTTPRGLPYPLPTEPVAEGAAAIRALAEALDLAAAPPRRSSRGRRNRPRRCDFPAIPQILHTPRPLLFGAL